MAKEAFSPPHVPEKTEPNYVEALINACIYVYKKFGSDSKTLDYMMVDEKTRAIVLENEKYKRSTKRIDSEKFLAEIDEIEDIAAALKKEIPDEDSYDIRNPKDAAAYEKDTKENVQLRLKVATMRRELLSINKEDEIDDSKAMNVFFIALTAEEFAAMQNVEIHEGTEEASLKEESKDDKAKSVEKFDSDEDMPPPFYVEGDGSIVEIPVK